MNQLDLEKWISHRLYRQHTSVESQIHVKNLALLGWDLKKTLIVDNTKENFRYQPDNGILVHTWYDCLNDWVLHDLGYILKAIVSARPRDLRTELKRFSGLIEHYTQRGEKIPD